MQSGYAIPSVVLHTVTTPIEGNKHAIREPNIAAGLGLDSRIALQWGGNGAILASHLRRAYSTVTLFAKFLGLSTSVPRNTAV